MSFVRELRKNQIAQIHVLDLETGTDKVIFYSSETLFEAPNWTKKGELIINGGGKLWSLNVETGELVLIPFEGLPEVNNDHVLAPDHESIYISTNDNWQIYKASTLGGPVQLVTPNDPRKMHFLHGVRPDLGQLAYVQISTSELGAFSNGKVHLLDLQTGNDLRLLPGEDPEDGPEYSIDGEWIYFNTEQFTGGKSGTLGHAQIAKVRLDGSDLEQLTFDNNVNWFPHSSPDGTRWVYLAYPAGTVGHPADLDVEIKLVENQDWREAKTIAQLFGGQGTINVNSWSPDSTKIAYVSYPFIS